MAGLRGILAALMIGNALVALPAAAQSRAIASLTHTVSVTVPGRVKVRVANLSVSSAAAATMPAVPKNVSGLSLSVNASQAWVLAIGSVSGINQQSMLQWSPNGHSKFSPLTPRDVPIAAGVGSIDAPAAHMFFRNTSSAAASSGRRQGETLVLTVSAP